MLLLDPTITKGDPLWRGYRNWEPMPGFGDQPSKSVPPRDSFFNDFVYWAKMADPACGKPHSLNQEPNIHAPIQALLHLICNEWLMMAQYIKTRLYQINWEIADPKHFLHEGRHIDVSLNKLHVWRRLVPLYREWLTETLRRLDHFPCHPVEEAVVPGAAAACPVAHGTPAANAAPAGGHHSFHLCHCMPHQPSCPFSKSGPISKYRADFSRAFSYMEEHQQAIVRLTSVVTAVIGITNSQQGLNENRNLARLTWLATFFIPLSFMASLFSMTEDLGKIRETFRIYGYSAVPLAILCIALAFTLGHPKVQKVMAKAEEFMRVWTGKKHHHT